MQLTRSYDYIKLHQIGPLKIDEQLHFSGYLYASDKTAILVDLPPAEFIQSFIERIERSRLISSIDYLVLAHPNFSLIKVLQIFI